MAVDFTKEYPFNAFETVVIDGETMVKVPKFYVRVYTATEGKMAGMKCWEVSEDKLDDSYHVHPAFVIKGKEIPYFYIGAYSAYQKSEKVAGSKAGQDAWTNIGGLEKARTFCKNRGEEQGWHLQTFYERSALQILALLEQGNGDSQTKFGAGNVNSSAAVKTGASNAAFHGIYELWGNYWEVVDGIKGDGSGNISIWDNQGNQTYVNTGVKPITGNYLANVREDKGANYDFTDMFIPSSVSAEGNSVFTDISEGTVNNNFTLLLGGDYKSGATQPGIFAVKWDKSVNDTGADITFRIAKYDVTTSNISYVYDGTAKTPDISSLYDATQVTANGDLTATNAGTYTIALTPNFAGYVWGDGTKGTKFITWSITPSTVDKPNISGDTEFVYDGTVKSIAITGVTSDINVEGNSNINAGVYSVVCSLVNPNNVTWSDGATNDVMFMYFISKQGVSIPSLSSGFTYDGTEKTPVVSVYNNTIISVVADSTTLKATNAGTYNYIFALVNPNNYEWSDGTVTNKAVEWNINRAKISTVPSQKNAAALVYNGSAKSPEWNDFDSNKLTIGGTISAINAGTYEATFTPTANYEWED